jgi:hypothetical protein
MVSPRQSFANAIVDKLESLADIAADLHLFVCVSTILISSMCHLVRRLANSWSRAM